MSDKTKTSETAKLKHYFLQGLLAFLILAGVLLTLQGVAGSILLAASLASTSFLIFARPHSPESNARNIVGGHVVAICIGAVFALLVIKLGLGGNTMFELTLGALAVGVALTIMAITDTEHAPAAGVALGMTIAHADLLTVAGTTLAGAALLTLARIIFKKHLYDLT